MGTPKYPKPCILSRTTRPYIVLLGVLVLASCSESSDRIGRTAGNDATFQILPEAPLAGNELRLAYGVNPAAMGSEPADAEDGDESRFVWSVNGQTVGRGSSLMPGLFHRRDRVTVRLAEDDASVERASVVISNSPPEIRGVSIRRDAGNPDLALADYDAVDPDGDRINYEFEWSIDGQTIQNNDGPELRLDNRSRGQEIVVTLWASDDELVVMRCSSPARLENHPPELSIASTPRIVEGDECDWAELGLSFSDPDGDDLEVQISGAIVSFDEANGVLKWNLADGTEEFTVIVQVSDPTGGSSACELRLKR